MGSRVASSRTAVPPVLQSIASRSIGFPSIALACIALLGPPVAAAQVVLPGAAGLGRPVHPLDARARSLGGVVVALHRSNLSAVNPASVADIGATGLWGTFMPASRSVEGTGVRGDLDVPEFPLFRAALPFEGDWTLTLGFGGFLDQDWTVQFIDTLSLSTGPLEFLETQSSDGGVSQIRLDVARTFSERWNLGMAAVLYRGETRRAIERAFPIEDDFTPYEAATAIAYNGWGLSAGAEYRPDPDVIVGGVVTWGSGLEARNDSTGTERDFDLPLTVDVGGSWQLTPDALVTAGFGWAGWSTVSDAAVQGGMQNSWRTGAGFELRAISGIEDAFFLRLGGRVERLPYVLRGGAPWERAFAAGVGAEFNNGVGRIDFTTEFGNRGSAEINGVEESFTRLIFSVSVFAR